MSDLQKWAKVTVAKGSAANRSKPSAKEKAASKAGGDAGKATEKADGAHGSSLMAAAAHMTASTAHLKAARMAIEAGDLDRANHHMSMSNTHRDSFNEHKGKDDAAKASGAQFSPAVPASSGKTEKAAKGGDDYARDEQGRFAEK